MRHTIARTNLGILWGLQAGGIALLVLAIGSRGVDGAAARSTAAARLPAAGQAMPATPGQDFQDVATSDPFYTYLHNLKAANIVSGYACQPGGPNDPCVPPDNLPYYHPGVAVSRLQMTKFIDNGRRNIADAVGTSLTISGTAYNTLSVTTTSGGSAIVGECLTPNTACYAVSGGAPAGDYAGYFPGGRGVYAGSQDSGHAALDTAASGSTAYGVNASSQVYRGLDANRNNTAFFSLYVDKTVGESA
ncbi:MAG TPA: hypothetical protein VKY74_17655, partial [Chloroflexia bacterium]|nr:hypothetical protein [Chloroflexia bacterium]